MPPVFNTHVAGLGVAWSGVYPGCRLFAPRLSSRPARYDQLRVTVPSICPWGSSVGTKISLGFSNPKGARLTSRQCLLGIAKDTCEISGAAFNAASPIWNKVTCTDGL